MQDVGIPAEVAPTIRLHGEEDAPTDDQRGQRAAEQWEQIGGRDRGGVVRLIEQFVTGAADRGAERCAIGVAIDSNHRPTGEKVRRCVDDAVDLDQRTLDATHAGGAVHAINAQGLGP